MHIEIIAVGQKMPDWVNQGFADYANRFAADITLKLTEIPLQKRASASQLASAQQKEAAQIRAAVQGFDHIVILDIPGREHSSESLARRLQHWQETSRRVALIIGGPEGIAADIKALAQESWSLGKLTLPHPLVRIVVAEALYRAWSINRNHPYHRA
ncbi:MAG: 23S rRNA (pseudouridine(1915)-N(3))-methyltransferase RlmH [Cardiobacteriaceae bacterium]|nr:23S rRNA (pseudouridine(1915)-N(3))-methyltransferase RlmH [Cardiobacteriaceae bacterium]